MTVAPRLVVCGTDFSLEAASALEWAAAFARRQGANVDLVHVVFEPEPDVLARTTDTAALAQARLVDARDRLAVIATAAERAADVPIRPVVLVGDPDARLVEHARRNGAAAIVIGASGRGAFSRWMLGSVAERTVRAAACPVVLVPGHDPESKWLRQASASAPPIKALIGVEGAEAGPLMRFAAELRRPARCDVTFLHLYWPFQEYARLDLRGARDPLTPDPEVVRALEPRLRPAIEGLTGAGAVALRIRPAWGEPSSNLLLALEDEGYDLLVVGSHQRHGLLRAFKGSVSESLAHQTRRLPVVCVPTPGAATNGVGAATGLPRMMTVLAATDLSEPGNAAVPHAYGLLRATGGVVELCYVHAHALPSPAYVYDQPPKLGAMERIALEKRLRASVPPEAEALGITTHVTIIDGGKPAETIVATAERLNVDAISLASHGRGGVARALLGSVANAVVRHAHRPVLVVRARVRAEG
jgi:nucleotide-binding universal stress UspA family protein